MRLRQFNRLPEPAVEEVLRRCWSVDRWVATVAAGHPFRRLEHLFATARLAASPLTPVELEAVLAHHPPVPLVPPQLRRGPSPAEIRVREQLTAGTAHYQQRFGRPFLTQPEGRLPAQLLVQLWERLSNDPDTEDQVIADQLHQLALTRLASLVTA